MNTFIILMLLPCILIIAIMFTDHNNGSTIYNDDSELWKPVIILFNIMMILMIATWAVVAYYDY